MCTSVTHCSRQQHQRCRWEEAWSRFWNEILKRKAARFGEPSFAIGGDNHTFAVK